MTSAPEFSVARRSLASVSQGPIRDRARTFSRVEIITAVRRWHENYGECPKMIDWEPSRARRAGQAWRAERFEEREWPSARMVRRQFGSFNAAIESAGLTPRPAPARQRANLSGPDAIVGALMEWTRRYGDVPTMADWEPARARRLGQDWRIARYHQGDWPSARSVLHHFGSFARAATAAGLTPRPLGVHHDGRPTERHANRLVAARASATGHPPGLAHLAEQVRAVSRARQTQDPVLTHAALVDLAGAALAWAELFGSD
jgi:Homing endonuclease associated repeat